MIEKIFLSIFTFALFLCVHVVIFHARNVQNRFRALVRIFFFCMGVYLVLAAMLPADLIHEGVQEEDALGRMITYLNGLIIYVLLFFSYAHFYFVIDRSISSRIMVDLLASPGLSGTFEDIARTYAPQGILKRRILDMVYGGYLAEEGGKYTLTAKGRLHGRFFRFLKRFIHLYPGG